MLKKREKELALVRLIDVEWQNLNNLSFTNISDRAVSCEISNEKFALPLTVEFPVEGGARVFAGDGGFFKPSAVNSIEKIYEKDNETKIKSGDITAIIKKSAKCWSIKLKKDSKNQAYVLKNTDVKFGINEDGLSRILFCARLNDDEIILGGGERYNTVVLNNTTFPLWNNDCWSANSSTYINVPLFHSSNGYSVFYNSTYGAIADIGYTNSKKYDLDFNGDIFDLYIYLDKPLVNIDSYTKLTGRPFYIPKWAFGYWAGGAGVYWNSRDKDGKRNYLELVKEAAEGYKRLGTIPVALYGEDKPSNNKDAYDVLRQYGIKMLGWNHPGATWEIREFTVDIYRELCPELEDSELPGIRRKSNPSEFYSIERGWVWGDYTNPNAITMINNKMKKAWDYGVKGAMVDYGEYVDEPMLFANGKTGDEMHNLYAYYYNKATCEAWYNRMGKDCILFARAGCAGSQRYCANFGGDQGSTFDGLRKALFGGVSISMSGFSGWGSDIGGLGGTPTNELYIRWLEFATFSPFMRAHGPSDHNPWAYGKKAEKIFKKLYWIRMALMDMLYSANLKTASTGEPLMKPLMLCYPDDKAGWAIEDQYILADELMICPVYTEGAKERNVYFPQGNWYELFSGKKQRGENSKVVAVPLGQPAVYLREGTVINTEVSSDNIIFGNELSCNRLKALIVTPPRNHRNIDILTDDRLIECSIYPEGKNIFVLEGNLSEFTALNVVGAEIKKIEVYCDSSDKVEKTDIDILYESKQKISAARLPLGWKKLRLYF